MDNTGNGSSLDDDSYRWKRFNAPFDIRARGASRLTGGTSEGSSGGHIGGKAKEVISDTSNLVFEEKEVQAKSGLREADPLVWVKRCQANMTHIRQSRPDSGLGF